MAETTPPRKPAPAAKPASAGGKPADLPKEAQTALGSVILRNEFYRDGYRTLMKIAFFQGIAIFLLILLSIGIINVYRPENRYFATTEDGRVVPMIPLSEPNLSRPALLSWAAQAATETMTFGFNDYRRRLQESSRHFTRVGWGSFVTALQQSGMIDAVTTRRQVLSAAPAAAPTIVSEGLQNGQYRWVVEMPLMITYQFGQESRSETQNLRITVVRVPRLESPNGVGIEQWVAYTGG